MTRDEAAFLATGIAQYWPHGGISTDVWERELVKLDHERAQKALSELKLSEDRSPSLARFYVRYNAHAPLERRIDCPHCDGGGWVPVTDDSRHSPRCETRGTHPDDPEDCHCSAVRPCTCVAGEAVEGSWARIARHDPRKVTF